MAQRWSSQVFVNGATSTLAAGVTSASRVVERFTGKTVQIEGVADGATATIQGRIGDTWVAIHSTVGVGLYEISQSVRELRVVINGGGGTTAILATYAGFDTRVSQ